MLKSILSVSLMFLIFSNVLYGEDGEEENSTRRALPAPDRITLREHILSTLGYDDSDPDGKKEKLIFELMNRQLDPKMGLPQSALDAVLERLEKGIEKTLGGDNSPPQDDVVGSKWSEMAISLVANSLIHDPSYFARIVAIAHFHSNSNIRLRATNHLTSGRPEYSQLLASTLVEMVKSDPSQQVRSEAMDTLAWLTSHNTNTIAEYPGIVSFYHDQALNRSQSEKLRLTALMVLLDLSWKDPVISAAKMYVISDLIRPGEIPKMEEIAVNKFLRNLNKIPTELDDTKKELLVQLLYSTEGETVLKVARVLQDMKAAPSHLDERLIHLLDKFQGQNEKSMEVLELLQLTGSRKEKVRLRLEALLRDTIPGNDLFEDTAKDILHVGVSGTLLILDMASPLAVKAILDNWINHPEWKEGNHTVSMVSRNPSVRKELAKYAPYLPPRFKQMVIDILTASNATSKEKEVIDFFIREINPNANDRTELRTQVQLIRKLGEMLKEAPQSQRARLKYPLGHVAELNPDLALTATEVQFQLGIATKEAARRWFFQHAHRPDSFGWALDLIRQHPENREAFLSQRPDSIDAKDVKKFVQKLHHELSAQLRGCFVANMKRRSRRSY